MLNLQTLTLAQLTMEFLRLVVNELGERRFEYIDEPIKEGERCEFISVIMKAEIIEKKLPEITREFANAIRPEFSRCYRLAALPKTFEQQYTARDPLFGVAIRCFRHWHVMEGEILYRFDAVFS